MEIYPVDSVVQPLDNQNQSEDHMSWTILVDSKFSSSTTRIEQYGQKG